MTNSKTPQSLKGSLRGRAATVLTVAAVIAGSLPMRGSPGVAAPAQRSIHKAAAAGGANSRALEVLERASRFLEEQEARLTDDAARRSASFAGQRLNLETTRQILELRANQPSSGTSDILAAARLAMVRQADGLGINLPPGGVGVKGQSPKKIALALLDRMNIIPTEEQKRAIEDLDGLPGPVKQALGRYMSAYLAFDAATRSALENLGKVKRDGLEMDQTAGLKLDGVLSARLSLLTAAEQFDKAIKAHPNSMLESSDEMGGPGGAKKKPAPKDEPAGPRLPASPDKKSSSAGLPEAPVHNLPAGPPGSGVTTSPPPPPAPALPPPAGQSQPNTPSAAVPMKLASADTPAGEAGVSSECQIGVFPAFCIDLRPDTGNIYSHFYALQIDAGGNDCYRNNAGGSAMAFSGASDQLSPFPAPAPGTCAQKSGDDLDRTEPFGGAAALLDLGGQDQYRTPNLSGGNGGGFIGAGFLLDLGSTRDSYVVEPGGPVPFTDSGFQTNALTGGLNGGAATAGVGFLLDSGGSDEYVVKTETKDRGPCEKGCAAAGTNGGAAGTGGNSSGFLLDGGGDDVYLVVDPFQKSEEQKQGQGEPCPSNSASVCTTQGANGGGASPGSSGFLVDLGGNDEFEAGAAGTNGGASGGGGGFLLDAGGNDVFRGGDGGVNGGARGDSLFTKGRSGFLFDGGGDDLYRAGKGGTNGAGDVLGALAGAGGLNPAAAMLLDAEGMDFYHDTSGPESDGLPSGRGWDRTVAPKHLGAQLDQNSPSADLEVTVEDSQDPVPSGTHLKYSVTAANKGVAPEHRVQEGPSDPSETCKVDQEKLAPEKPGFPLEPCPTHEVRAGRNVAQDVTVTDQLPPKANFSFASPACSYLKKNHTVTCRLGDLGEGEQAKAEIVVTPHKSPGTGTETIWNTVSVASSPASDADPASAPTPDPNRENNRAKESTVIRQGEPVRSVSIADAPAVQEGASGTQASATFRVSLSGPASESAVKVDYATADGTAKLADDDYERAAGQVQFQPGETSQTVTVPVNVKGDDSSEADEFFAVNLVNPTNAIVDKGQGEGTILDDDALPTISIDDVAVEETDSGSGVYAGFTVSLSNASGQAVSLDYATADGTATVEDRDYEPLEGTLNFAPGQTAQTLNVTVAGDGYREPDETFSVKLANAKKAVIARGQGRGTIRDDRDTENRPGPPKADYEGKRIDVDSYDYTDMPRQSGGVFVTGHDADKHAGIPFPEYATRALAAQRVVQTAVKYVTGAKPAPRMLYVTVPKVDPRSLTRPPAAPADDWEPPSDWVGAVNEGLSTGAETQGGAEDEAIKGAAMRGMTQSGYAYDIAAGPGAVPAGAVKDLRTVDFRQYDVVVVACADVAPNLGCGLSQAELDILNSRLEELISYVSNGGGLVAFAQSGLRDQFAFLPFLRPSTDVLQYESEFRATSFGKRLGLRDEDVQVNFSHNIFLDDTGFGVVDVDGLGRMVSLATRKIINRQGIIPQDQGNGSLQPAEREDGLPRSTTDAASQASPVLRGDAFDHTLPPSQPVGKPEHQGFARDPVTQGAAQPAAQTQADMHQQAQQQALQQAQQQAESQNQMQVQVQAAPSKQQQREAQVQLAPVEAGPRRAPGPTPAKAREYLATGRQPVSPWGAVLGGMAFSMLALLAFAKQERQKTPRAARVGSGAGTGPAQRPAPAHRRR